jgi:hypothetical protein
MLLLVVHIQLGKEDLYLLDGVEVELGDGYLRGEAAAVGEDLQDLGDGRGGEDSVGVVICPVVLVA